MSGLGSSSLRAPRLTAVRDLIRIIGRNLAKAVVSFSCTGWAYQACADCIIRFWRDLAKSWGDV